MINEYLPVILGAVVVIVLIAMLVRDTKRSDIDIPAPAQLRTDLLFGYYGSYGPSTEVSQVEETRDHVNVHWESFWRGEDVALRDLRLARDAGMALVVDVSADLFERVSPTQLVLRQDAEQRLDARCRWLIEHGLTGALRSLFILDEPDLKENQACNLMPEGAAIMRRVMARLPELAGKRISVNYTENFCHKHLFDDISFDDYPARSGIFAQPHGKYWRLVKDLLSHQRTFLIPGGYSDCRQNPRPFINFAHGNPEVAGIIVFIRRDPHGNGFQGTASDPEMDALYVAAGRSIVAPARGSP